MGRETEYLTETTKRHHIQFRGYSRLIIVLWVIFTVCFTILNCVSFIQPQWLGDTVDSPRVGYFGLYERCERLQVEGNYKCQGDFMDLSTLTNNSFRAASVLVGLSALLFVITCLCVLFFFFLKAASVLRVCGCLQLIATLCMAAGCIIFPSGWDDYEVRSICGQEADKYKPGHCMIRWSYILAIVLIFDGLALTILAFCLAAKQANLLEKYQEEKLVTGLANGGFITDSLSKTSGGSGTFMHVEKTRDERDDEIPVIVAEVGDFAPGKEDIHL